MTSTDTLTPDDFRAILANDSLEIHFQQVVSMRRKCILLAEALVRGIHPQTGRLIPPRHLFHEAAEQGKLVALDRACRKQALQAYAKMQDRHKDILLSVNFASAIIDENVVGSNHLLDCIRETKLNPQRIVLEIVEAAVDNTDALRAFTERYRAEGFLIALDDFGAGHSNIDRIALLKPDIIKLDIDLIRDVHKQYHKRQIVKSLVMMAHQIGAIAIAEGVESEEELLVAQQLGIDMFQGYLFGKPGQVENGALDCPDDVIDRASHAVHAYVEQETATLRDLHEEFCELQDEIIETLEHESIANMHGALSRYIIKELALEAIYILDEDGALVTDTVVQEHVKGHTRSCLLSPAPRGTDLSLKPYYEGIRAGMERYMSEPYLSQATGDMCITLSKPFNGKDKARYILCCDIAFGAPETL